MHCGVIHVARGAGYRDLALASARSLREQGDGLENDIFTDMPVPAGADFALVHPIPQTATRDKIACMAASRFERTLFLDCDTLVVQPLGDLFDLLDRFDLAVAHDVRRLSPLIRAGHAVQTPYAFPQFNTGVVLYRRSPAMAEFLAEWGRRHAAAGLNRDQPTFRDLLWQSDLRFHVLPPEFNLRRVTLMDAWEPLDARPTIIHSHRLLQHLRGEPERVTDVARLMELERAALAEEWQALGLPARPAPGADPVARHARAEAGGGPAAGPVSASRRSRP